MGVGVKIGACRLAVSLEALKASWKTLVDTLWQPGQEPLPLYALRKSCPKQAAWQSICHGRL